MMVNFTEEDLWIARGIAELRALAIADIRQAHDEPAMRLPASNRTLDLYPRIVSAVEIDRDANSN
jgi:hypothetical protein